MGKKHKKKARKNANVNQIDINVNVGNPREEKCESEKPTQGAEPQAFLTILKEFAEKIKFCKNIIAKSGLSLVGFVSFLKGNNELFCIVVGVFVAMLGDAVISKIIPKDRGILVIATVVFFVFGTIGSLAATEYVYERFEKLDLRRDRSEKVGVAEPENEAVQQSKAESEIDMTKSTEAIESTESPISTYVEIRFEDEISSRMWRELMLSTERIGVTGTKENFYRIKENALQMVEGYVPEQIVRPFEAINADRLQENMDDIDQMDYEGNTWAECVAICRMRCENYEENPNLENVIQKKVSSMNCLFEMGKVNGKEGKLLDERIYNKDNILLYGNSVVDGCAEWWYAVSQTEPESTHKYNEICESFGEAFHHLSGADEMMTKEASIALLALSAVFCSESEGIVEDKSFHTGKRAAKKRADACMDLAIIYDKLDNTLSPEDPFYLLEAENYYNCSLESKALSGDKEEKVKTYLDIVIQKKQRRGL